VGRIAGTGFSKNDREFAENSRAGLYSEALDLDEERLRLRRAFLNSEEFEDYLSRAVIAQFEEAKHPRANDGKFGSGGGSASGSAKPKNNSHFVENKVRIRFWLFVGCEYALQEKRKIVKNGI